MHGPEEEADTGKAEAEERPIAVVGLPPAGVTPRRHFLLSKYPPLQNLHPPLQTPQTETLPSEEEDVDGGLGGITAGSAVRSAHCGRPK